MEREAFLDRLRARLAVPAPPNLAHPLPRITGVPRARFAVPSTDPVATFEKAAAAHGAKVRVIAPTSAALGGLCDEILAEQQPRARSAVVTDEPETAGAAALLEARGLTVVASGDPSAAASADLGITGALWGIAAIGAIAVHSRRAGGRTASLLPPVHVGIVRASRILATPADFWRDALPSEGPPPSQVVLISGPSRSADIESRLTIGVHGPRVVWFVVLDDRPRSP